MDYHSSYFFQDVDWSSPLYVTAFNCLLKMVSRMVTWTNERPFKTEGLFHLLYSSLPKYTCSFSLAFNWFNVIFQIAISLHGTLALLVGIYHPLCSTVHYMSPYMNNLPPSCKFPLTKNTTNSRRPFLTSLPPSSAGPGFSYCFLRRLMFLI